MFEQDERWLDELVEYTNRKESRTCSSGHMPLTAIAQEIATACADTRQHSRQQIPNWQSMASDLSDTLDWIGPDLQALVDAPARAIHHQIANDLLATGPNGGARLYDTKRPVIAAQTTVLTGILNRDDVLVAAWRDLVSARHRPHPVPERTDRVPPRHPGRPERVPQAGSRVLEPHLDCRAGPARRSKRCAARAGYGRRPNRRSVRPRRSG